MSPVRVPATRTAYSPRLRSGLALGMTTALSVVSVVSVLSVLPLSAQTQSADSAWRAGNYAAARVEYQRVLAQDSTSTRSLYRLAVLTSWDNKLDSSLMLIRRARALEPLDPDLRFTEAQVLSWASEFDASLQKWDSLLLLMPERRDAALARARTLAWANRFNEAGAAYEQLIQRDSTDPAAYVGRGQVYAWKGDHSAAIADYERALRIKPNDADALVALAQLHHWQGRNELARAELGAVLQADSTNREARQVSRLVRAAVRPRIEVGAGWNRDSDENQTLWQSLGSSMMLAGGLRGFVNAGLAQLDDPFRDANRVTGEVAATYAFANLQATAGVGARRLEASDSDQRSETTGRASLSWRPAPSAGVGIGWSHYPFDETALLIGSGLDLDNVDLAADVDVTPSFSVSAGGGRTWFSDGNERTGFLLAATKRLSPRWFVGVLGRTFSFDEPGVGYFSPDRYTLLEGRGGYSYAKGGWSARATAGLGGQKVADNGVQVAWRAELRGAYSWSAINRLELFGGTTRNAGTSVAGAYQYWSAGVSVVVGL